MKAKIKRQPCDNSNSRGEELRQPAVAGIDLKQSVVPDVVIPLGNGKEIRLIPVDSVKFRRRNYRRMDARTWQALDRSFEKFGLASVILVHRGKDGGYYMVDGHHRLDMAKKKGYKWIPAFVFPEDVDPKDLDLAMLAFNITAEIDPDPYLDLVSDLMKEGADVEEVSLFTGLDESTINLMTDEGEEGQPGDEMKFITSPPRERSSPAVGRLFVVTLPREYGIVVQKLCEQLGLTTPAEVVSLALDYVSKQLNIDNNDSET
jgi:hypothetical protein